MNSIQSQRKDLENKITQISSRLNKYAFLVLASAMITVGFTVLGFNSYTSKLDSRLTEIEASINSIKPSNIQAEQQQNPQEYSTLNGRLTSLENLQGAIISTSKGALEQMNFIFVIVASFFGLFSLFFAFRQLMSDASREGNDQEMRSLVSSFQNNITTINSLIVTLEKSFDYRNEIAFQLQTINERADSLEAYKNEGELVFASLIRSLNSESLHLFDPEMSRYNLSIEENIRKLENFAIKLNNAEVLRNPEDYLNPFCYFERGLRNLSIYQYELAEMDFQLAYKKAKIDLAEPKIENYSEQDRGDIKQQLHNLLVACSYFQGISYKNLGKYRESIDSFHEALKRNPNYLQAKTYMLQVMFFDASIQFRSIEKEYNTTIEQFKKIERSENIDKKKVIKAFHMLYINRGNMFLQKSIPCDSLKSRKKYENQEKALKYYWTAYDYLNDDISSFSVAQAMEGLGQASWRDKDPQELYKVSMSLLKRKVAVDHDHLYSIMLYYMLAICARKLGESSEVSEVFLSQARHNLRQVPRGITCFSPISKVRLSRSELLEEMDIFERAF